MAAEHARPTGMLFSRPLIVESALPVVVVRARIRAFATARGLSELESFRRRQIIGWRLSELHEDFLFQPEYGDALDIDGARFVGLVEASGSTSRVRGLIVLSPLSKLVVSAFMLSVMFAGLVALAQAPEPPAKVLTITAAMLGAAVLVVRYGLASTRRVVAARLHECLEPSEPRVAA